MMKCISRERKMTVRNPTVDQNFDILYVERWFIMQQDEFSYRICGIDQWIGLSIIFDGNSSHEIS